MNRIAKCLVAISASLILLFPNIALATSLTHALPRYSLIEFNIAFILGLSLPILVIIALLKPIVAISWRYPALITFALLGQFYALGHLQQWQALVLLCTAAAFVTCCCLWQVEQKATALNQVTFNAIIVGLFLALIGMVIGFRAFDVYKIWLGFVVVNAIIAISTLFFLPKGSLLRTVLTWGVTTGYGVALYLWLNVQLDVVWVIALAILSYLAHMLSGCWSMVHKLVDKFEQVKLAVHSEPNIVTQPEKSFDPITNLPTYQQGLFEFNKALKAPGNNCFVAIVFKPLYFAQVNKVLGHQNSDILLLQLAYNLQKSVRENSLLLNFGDEQSDVKICRLQGLDFLVVVNASLSEHPSKIVVDDICQQLNKSVPQAISFKSFSLNFQLAFGVAIATPELHSSEQLIAQASDALLVAEQTQQTISYFDQQSSLYTEQQLARMEKLKDDINGKKLVWLAHPQVSLVDGKFVGFELVIDWHAGDGSRLSDQEFANVAQFSGEIYRITKQLLQQAFQLLATMHGLGFAQKVAINLSSKELLEPELSDFIEHQSEICGIAPHFLTIEVSEQVFLGSPFRARMMIDQLRALGISIAIDDFSGSYEALRYLRRTSVQQVKIECSKLNITAGDNSEKTIVNALVNLIRKMDLPLIATGVNNKEIENSYLLMGGNIAQGNAIQSGIALEQVTNWLAAWQARTERA